jgi:protein-S-isoprenylcysteine O-methyltransferase Ste14
MRERDRGRREAHRMALKYAAVGEHAKPSDRTASCRVRRPGRRRDRVRGAVIDRPGRRRRWSDVRAGLRQGSSIATTQEIACNLLLAGLYLSFAVGQIAFARATGEWVTTMPLVAQEALVVVLFVTRRRSLATSSRARDWLLGLTGVVLPMFLHPQDPLGPLSGMGRAVLVTALLLSVVALTSLGRSLGVVAADRGIKTSGAYRWVRHPVYACHLLSYTGYVACYPTVGNAVLATAGAVALVARARIEERFLSRDVAYRRYLADVPWRFVPGVY